MNICKLVLNVIEKYPSDEPIFIEDIKNDVLKECEYKEKENVLKNINVILNRLKNKGIVKTAYKGIYYKPIINIFGEVPLSNRKIIELKYLIDKNRTIKGYITGAKLFNDIGFTTQVPSVMEIVTNECKYHKQFDEKFRTYIIKPRIEVTNENYQYLQFIDIIENRENINIEIKEDKLNQILYEIIEECDLDFEKIIKYARETNSPKILEKLFVLAR